MNKKQKKNLTRILITAVLLIALHFIPSSGLLRLLLYMIPYLLIGYDILIKAWKGIRNRQPLDENLLMAIATLGALVLGWKEGGDYTEAVGVMLFYQVGEWFQSYAVGKSRRNISELMDIRPDYANIMAEDGTLQQVDPDEVEIGSIIVVQPGEKIPIDGIVVSGSAALNTAALTGESLPREVGENDEVISGCIDLDSVLQIRTTREFGESTVSKILDLVENASSRKSRSEDFISRFARIYTPAVVISALVLAFLPPLVRVLVLHTDAAFSDWLYRALTFLVISCPCALVISIPLSFFAGIGGASREGVLVKGSNFLESLSRTKYLVFDKTGTLTKGVFEVTGVHHSSMDRQELLDLAAHAESASSHPISRSLREAYGEDIDRSRVSDIQEIVGCGLCAVVDGRQVGIGNEKLMRQLNVESAPCHDSGTIIHVCVDGKYAGHIVIADVIREHAGQAVQELKQAGVVRTVMLTGDRTSVAEDTAAKLGIDEVHSELLPEDKVTEVERLLKEKPKGAVLAFAGDGINDAPVLSRADIGIAMGAMGSDAAIEAADVVLMDDDPQKIAKAIRISRKCIRIVYENIWFAIGVKIICLVLSALGYANMWLAIFADVGVMILAVLNAIRALRTKNA